MHYQDDIPPELLVALDACRPDSTDEELPEVAAAIAGHSPRLVERARRHIQQADRVIAAVVQQVPVPEGLAERILANLAHQPPTGCSAENQERASAPMRPRPWALARRRRVPRWILAGGAVVAVAAVALFTFVGRHGDEAIDAVHLEQYARNFYADDDQGGPLVTTAPPNAFPLDDRLAHAQIKGWRKVAQQFLNVPTIAYELVSQRGAKATLYVIDSRSLNLTDIGLDPQPPVSTGGVAIGAWQSGGQLFVLVVQGGRRDFETFFPQASLT